jgi:hypothetical protein
MSTQADQLGERVIVTGRAYVRVVEAADVLLDRRPVWTERLLLQLVRALWTHRLRGLVAESPSEMTAETLAPSEKMKGVVVGFTQN